MDSIPSAKRSSASGEKTGTSSRASSGRRAAPHKGLSRSASTAIVSQSVALSTGKELLRGFNGALDLGQAVRRGDEHRLELRGRKVNAAVEQVAEKRGEALEIGRLRRADPHACSRADAPLSTSLA